LYIKYYYYYLEDYEKGTDIAVASHTLSHLFKESTKEEIGIRAKVSLVGSRGVEEDGLA
jgi:hypothetical protein